MKNIHPPAAGEYAPYYSRYISKIPHDTPVLDQLHHNAVIVKELITSLPEEKLLYRYEPGKWSIKEVLVHIIDTERIMAYRALRIARNDQTPIPGFEQDDYVPYSAADARDITDIMEEYEAVRKATLTLFHSFTAEAFDRKGTASENTVSVRALAYIITGHELHHLQVLQEKYLLS